MLGSDAPFQRKHMIREVGNLIMMTADPPPDPDVEETDPAAGVLLHPFHSRERRQRRRSQWSQMRGGGHGR